MSETVIAALIGLGGSALGAFGGIVVNSRMMSYRLEQLEARFKETTEQNNALAARISKLENDNEVQKEQIRTVFHQLEEVMKKVLP